MAGQSCFRDMLLRIVRQIEATFIYPYIIVFKLVINQ